jgi:hypothetical protein
MNHKHKAWICSLVIAGAALLALPAFAIRQEAVLGNDGELYIVKTGTYGALFPGGQETDRNNSVLALEIAHHGEAPQRVLVPDTLDKAIESSPAVFFETDSNTIFLVWESRLSATEFSLRLASFDGSHWTPTIEVTKSTKSSPQLAATLQLVTTRDFYKERETPDSKPVVKHRTVLHLTWSEEGAGELSDESYYTPIILDEGTFIGVNPIFRLNSFDKSNDEPAGPVASELVRSPMVQAGDDMRTVLVSFTSAITGRLIVLEIDVLPTQIRRVADKARASIIDLGAQKPDLQTVAVKARDSVLNYSGDFQPEVARSLADLLYAHILAGGSPPGPVNDLKPIADDARATIIDLGAKFSSGQVLKSTPAQLFQIVGKPEAGEEEAPAHLLQVRTASSRPVPAIGPGMVRVFVSESGANALVSWATKDRVYYRDSVSAYGWSDVRELKLNDGFDLNRAYEVLDQRVQNR